MARANKIVKKQVVACRLTLEQLDKIQSELREAQMVGVTSVGMLSRKLLLDFAYDGITWRNKRQKAQAPEMYLPNKAGTVIVGTPESAGPILEESPAEAKTV